MKGRLAAVLAGCMALAGCAGLPGFGEKEPVPWVQASAPQPASDAESLLLYFQHLRKLSSADLGRELETVRYAYARARTDFNRVRFAMLLSLPNAVFTDEGRALEMLEPGAKNPGARLQALAQLLSSNLQEQKKLNAGLQGLQQKLDALKSLERNMIERNR